MQSYETIKGERDLLNKNQERKEEKYWVLKKEANNLKIRSIALQQNKVILQRQV
jgi:hypothetical protein